MVKRILAAIAAVVMVALPCTLVIAADDNVQTEATPTKWDDVNVYVEDYIASTMDCPEHFDIAQWVRLANSSDMVRDVQSMYVNMVWNNGNEGVTADRVHYLDRRYYDIVATGEEIVADVNYYVYLVSQDVLTQPIGLSVSSLRLYCNSATFSVLLFNGSNPSGNTNGARVQFLYDIVSVGDSYVELSLRSAGIKLSDSGSLTNYTPALLKGWLIYSVWDGENIVQTNSPYERVMLAAMNYTPIDYQTEGDLNNGDLYYYGVIDYEAIVTTWTEMQRYAVDLGTYMYGLGEQVGYDEGFIDGRNRGHDEGYDIGYEDGYSIGNIDGFGRGEQVGYDEGLIVGDGYGYERGFMDGDKVGYDRGMATGSGLAEDALAEMYTNGYSEGYDEGLDLGYGDGYRDGVIDGEVKGMTTSDSFGGFFVSLFEAPVTLFSSMLDFDFLGINVLGFVKVLLTLSVVGAIVFVVFKFMK